MRRVLLATSALTAFMGIGYVANPARAADLAAETSEAAPARSEGQGEASAQAQAQSAAATTPGVQDIIVTAQRERSSVQKSSINVSVITPEQIRNAGVQQARDLGKIDPGVVIGQGGPSTQIYIRGVGDFGSKPQSNPAVAFNVDGVYVARSSAVEGNFYDLERIEVVKGPQGTLYGRNATGGAINVITNSPSLEGFRGYLEGEAGDYSLGRVEGYLNVPVTDSFALRGAFQVANRNGYTEGGFDDDKHQSFRLSALWKPSDALTIRLTYDHTHVGGVGPGYVVKGPYAAALLPYVRAQGYSGFPTDPRMVFTNPQAQAVFFAGEAVAFAAKSAPTCFPLNVPAASATRKGVISGGMQGACPPGFQTTVNPAQVQNTRGVDNKFDNITAQLDWNLGFATLTVLPAYRRVRDDYTATQFFVFDGAYQGVPEKSDEYSAEVRLAHSGSRLNWVLGGLYWREDQSAQTGTPGGGPLVDPLATRAIYHTTSVAGFGQATYSVTPFWRLIAGGRYTNDRRSLDQTIAALDSPVFNIQYNALNGLCFKKASPCVYSSAAGSMEKDQFTYKLGTELDVAAHNMLYLTYSTGYKAGGLNPFTSPSGGISIYLPEKLYAWALGSKNRFFDSKLQVNMEAFYWRYHNAQEQYSTLDANNNPQAGYSNAKRATMYGVDIDVVGRISRNDTLRVSGEYLHSKFNDFSYTSTFLIPGIATGCRETRGAPFSTLNCSGMPTTRAPKWSGSASFTHVFDMADHGDVEATISGQWASSRYLTVDYTAATKADAYAQGDAYLTYRPRNGRWSMTAYVRNFTNALNYTGAFTLPTLAPGVVAANLAPPRTFGAIVGVKF